MTERRRRITVEIPTALLEKAQSATGEGITATVCRGLERLATTRSFEQIRALRGKVRFSINLDELRSDEA